MTGASFAGTDKNGEPFKIRAASARQEYDKPDEIFMERVSGTITRNTDQGRVVSDISANSARYNNIKKTITLIGNVRVNSSTGDKIFTDELVIKL